MQRSLMRWFALNLALLGSITSQSRMQPQTQILTAVPLTSQIPVAPIPVKSKDKWHLLYELHLLNSGSGQLELTRLEVLKGDASVALLASYQETELSSRLVMLVPGIAQELPDKRVIPGGRRALIYLQLIIEAASELPSALRHRLFFKSVATGENGGEGMIECASVQILRTPPLVLGAPLRGKNWRAGACLSNDSNHRRAVIGLKDSAPIASRFAIDWAKLGADGTFYHTDDSKNTNYYGYGEEVLAVADAVVVSVKDGMPENIPKKVPPFSIFTAGGNFVMLDLGNSRFAYYAHLQPKSLRVKVGDKVRRGQVLALLGDSGNSIGPHLHFHIVDDNSDFYAEGMPYVFESFDALSVKVPGVINSRVDKRRMEIPNNNDVVNFP